MAILVAGLSAVGWFGLRVRSLFGAAAGMVMTLTAVAIITPGLADQLSLVMVGLGIVMLIAATVLVGWVWNVAAMVKWRREKSRAEGSRRDEAGAWLAEWQPWVAWYPVKTDRGWAWMRYVQVRQSGQAGQGVSRRRLEFREQPAA